MRRSGIAGLVIGLVLAAAASAPAPADFRVTRRSLTRVDLDGGRVDGLRPGDRLRIVDGAGTVAELEVVHSAERSARCKVISLKRPVSVGDVAVPVATAREQPSASVSADEPPSPPAVSQDPSTTPAPARAPRASGPSFAVEYRSADSVYVDGGRAAGLDVGDRLQLLDGQTVVAELEVLHAAERSASCRVLRESRPVHQGDRVVLVARAGPTTARTAVGGAAPAASPRDAAPPAPSTTGGDELAEETPGVPWARVYGAASIGYYRSWDGSETDLDYQERTARVDLVASDIAGQPLSFALRGRLREDIRARELSRRSPASVRTDRIYELALRYDPPDSRVGFELGRIGVSRFVGIGYLDGALVRFLARPGIQVGAFGGRQADLANLDGTGHKYGGFVRLSPGGRYARGGYDVLLAFVRENAEGEVSREYLSLESRFAGGGRWSLFQRAELDVNRGWRQEVTGKSYQLSNLGLSGNLKVSPSSWLFVSYDGLRNYRYYRNRWIPEDVFDSLLRQGLRAGVNVSKPGGFGAAASFGMSLKEQDPIHPDLDIANAYFFNGGVRHSSLFRGISVGLDGSGFTNGYTKGGLVSARAGWRAAAGHTLDLSFGYSRYRVEQTQQDRAQQWLRLIGRAELGRRLYVLGDLEYDNGDDLEGPRAFVELGVLF
ncbi:MAG: hypothetical protein PVJ73_03365 [Acidobacteriota bacterium]|jgi:hypothetical protein